MTSNGNNADALGYLNNRNLEHNFYWFRIIQDLDIKTILELGSNCGPRMIEIARNNPQYDFLGCDINEHAVKLGNNFARENGIDNLKLFQHNLCTGGICKSPILEQKQVDLLFSWATLIYIKPREISDVLLDVLSLKPKYMLVIEVEPYRNRLNLETGHPALLEPFYVRSYTEIVSRLAHSLELIVENILVQDVPTQVRNPRGGIPRSLLFQFKQAH